jgi:8-oxo-dGTP pyrophosphatase MutT (NUDIX family)
VDSRAALRRLAKRVSSSQAGEVPGRQQVAAVCYRLGDRGLEFLLVQTRGGRWIFPKGGVEPGLTQAQSAALEAFEEAGVHGRIEEMPFARYRNGKSAEGSRKAGRSPGRPQAVTAHLCEVSRLEPPREANRKPTWFSAEKAKRRLLEDRKSEFGVELARVVDRAVARVERMRKRSAATLGPPRKDGLQEVRFEAFELRAVQGFVWSATRARHYGVLQADLRQRTNRAPLRLGDGAAPPPNALQVAMVQKAQFTDDPQPAPKTKTAVGPVPIRRR